MAMFKCSLCSQRPRGRLASGYWAYIGGDGQRVSFKQRYCQRCFENEFQPFWEQTLQRDSDDWVDYCAVCHEKDATQLENAWGTMFVPGKEAESLILTFCRQHKSTCIDLIERNKIELVDRTGGFAAANAWG